MKVKHADIYTANCFICQYGLPEICIYMENEKWKQKICPVYMKHDIFLAALQDRAKCHTLDSIGWRTANEKSTCMHAGHIGEILHYVQHSHGYQLTELVYQASIPRSTYLYTNNTPIEHDLCSTHLQSY